MGKGHLNKEELVKREQFDSEVEYLAGCGYEKEEIAVFLGCNKNKVAFSLHRLQHGVSMEKPRRNLEEEARKEAELLIDAKMAPVVKPKAKRIMVNGWENGHYVHYPMWDVSEFWGL